jgi:hypothetical protein
MEHYIENIIAKPGISKKDLKRELNLKIDRLKVLLNKSNLKSIKNGSGFFIKDKFSYKSILFTIDIFIKPFDEYFLIKYKTNIPTGQALMILKEIKASLEEK